VCCSTPGPLYTTILSVQPKTHCLRCGRNKALEYKGKAAAADDDGDRVQRLTKFPHAFTGALTAHGVGYVGAPSACLSSSATSPRTGRMIPLEFGSTLHHCNAATAAVYYTEIYLVSKPYPTFRTVGIYYKRVSGSRIFDKGAFLARKKVMNRVLKLSSSLNCQSPTAPRADDQLLRIFGETSQTTGTASLFRAQSNHQ
jgi:hypothetical protein